MQLKRIFFNSTYNDILKKYMINDYIIDHRRGESIDSISIPVNVLENVGRFLTIFIRMDTNGVGTKLFAQEKLFNFLFGMGQCVTFVKKYDYLY